MERYNPKELVNCTGCADVGTSCLNCNLTILEQRPEGRLLRRNVGARFGRWSFEDTEKWIEYLGDDVDPVKHGYFQALNVALPMIEYQQAYGEPFTEEEAKLLLLANVFHDAHEGLSGDVAKPKKTPESDEAELKLNLRVVASILGEQPESPFMQKYRGVVGDFEGWSHAGRAFAAGEWCGYFLSGLRAWSLRNHAEFSDEEREACREMGDAVIRQDVPVLKTYADEVPFIKYLLAVNQTAIDEVLNAD